MSSSSSSSNLSSNDDNFDDLFFALAQKSRTIENLLEVVFSFLERRTNFFHINTAKPQSSMGFESTEAFEVLKRCFSKHQLSYLSRAQPDLLPMLTTNSRRANEKHKNYNSSRSTNNSNSSSRSDNSSSRSKIAEVVKEAVSFPSGDIKQCNNTDNKSSKTQSAALLNQLDYKRISVLNGGKSEEYWWNQTLPEASFDLLLPSGFNKSHLIVTLKAEGVQVHYEGNPLLQGQFYEPIKLENSFWSVEDNTRLCFTLEKSREKWWGNILKQRDEIDLNKVDSVRKIEEFDEESRTAIAKVMYDEEMKRLGLKTSEQLQAEELLKKALESPSSPFFQQQQQA